MTPYEIECIQQEQEANKAQAELEAYSEGQTNAAFLDLPKYNHPAYLAGYVDRIRNYPSEGGLIQYPDNQRKYFSNGLADKPGSFEDDWF